MMRPDGRVAPSLPRQAALTPPFRRASDGPVRLFRFVRGMAGCGEIIEEKASGTDRSRPALAQLLGRLRRGDTLVVVRIDRLARSLAHLLAMLDRLQGAGVHFRSLSDPIDTANPTGRL